MARRKFFRFKTPKIFISSHAARNSSSKRSPHPIGGGRTVTEDKKDIGSSFTPNLTKLLFGTNNSRTSIENNSDLFSFEIDEDGAFTADEDGAFTIEEG